MARARVTTRVRLQTGHDLIKAFEELFNKQMRGEVDSKVGNAMVATLNGSAYLVAKLPYQYARLRVMAAELAIKAHKQKLELPNALLLLPPARREARRSSARSAR